MLMELTPSDEEGDVDMVMLCLEHTDLYKPTGKVISDTWLPTKALDAETLLANPSTEEINRIDNLLETGGPDAVRDYLAKNRE